MHTAASDTPPERLSGLDAVFLAVENDHNPMSIGTVGLFEGPPPALDDLRTFLFRRLPAVPRCRQRLHSWAGSLTRPVWIDDASFDLRQHVRALSLRESETGDFDELVADLVSTPLDRRRPLWQIWLVTDLDDGTWAIIAVVHHCMVDGIAGRDLMSAILSESTGQDTTNPVNWIPSVEPATRTLIWCTVRAAIEAWAARLRGAARLVIHPYRTVRRARSVLTAARRLWWRQPHEPTSLVGPIGRGRRWTHIDVPLADLRTIEELLGGTVNDIVLTAVSMGFRDLLISRGEPTSPRSVTALVPVSRRISDERGELGNRVANVHARLPVDVDDPRDLHRAIRHQLDDLKTSHEVDATGLLMNIGEFVPRFVADRIARAVFHRQRNVETVVTNVPGPREPLFLDTHQMISAYPVAPIGGLVRTTVAMWSYCDRLFIGITGDRDSVPDIERLAMGISRGFIRLVEIARSDARS